MGLMAQLEIDERVIVTDDDWKWGYGPILSSEIYDGEVYDANQEDIKYDQAVRVIAGPGAGCRLIASEAPPVRRMETVRAKEIIKTPSGKTIVDFGQNLVRYPEFYLSW
jgi:alpha-L-rhamnosidase